MTLRPTSSAALPWRGGQVRSGPGPLLMGILNVTPDSFSDGGRHMRLPAALRSVSLMVAAGVDIFDVGGESTRPGADPVDEQVEILRVVPVIEAIKSEHDVRVSIDTRRASRTLISNDANLAYIPCFFAIIA